MVSSRYAKIFLLDSFYMVINLDLFDDEDQINLQYQEALSSRVSKQMTSVLNLLTRSLNIHLNVEQQFTLNTSNVFMSLETLKGESLRGKEIQSVGNARLRLPSSGNLSLDDEHQSGSLRVRSSSSFYLSTSLSLSSSVYIGTLAFVWLFVEHESVSIDFVDLDGSRRK
jgi:hypothetical protein